MSNSFISNNLYEILNKRKLRSTEINIFSVKPQSNDQLFTNVKISLSKISSEMIHILAIL